MSEPIVFIIRNRIKKGKADEFRKHYRGSIKPMMAAQPGTVAQLVFENEEATEKWFAFSRTRRSWTFKSKELMHSRKRHTSFIEPVSIEIFGTPNPAILEAIRKMAGSGVAVSISPHYIGGLIW